MGNVGVFVAPEFKARSGRAVKTLENGHLRFDNVNGYLGAEAVMDAEEFFQAKRDAELGRWRWPSNPDYVVYLAANGQAIVIDERSGLHVYRYRGEAAEMRRLRAATGEDIMLASKAAEAYFEAHPERKPWHDAKPGDVWLLTLDGVESAFYPSKSLARHFTPVAPNTGTTAISFDWPEIEAGRCIFTPEDAS